MQQSFEVRLRALEKHTSKSLHSVKNSSRVASGPQLGYKRESILKITRQIFLPAEQSRRRGIQWTLRRNFSQELRCICKTIFGNTEQRTSNKSRGAKWPL